MANISLILVHYPVMDKNGVVVTSALTNMDIHDIARTAKTYGVRRFYVATPVRALRAMAAKIMQHWDTGFGSTYNVTRRDALELVRLEYDLDSTIVAMEEEMGKKPRLVMTSAKSGGERRSFAELRNDMASDDDPYLLVFGTGWGLAPPVLARADLTLEPVHGCGDYNHLSVRSAAAIILDRLVGPR